jgi:L-rhamnose mutarotase
MAMKLRLSLRYNLQNNVNDDLRQIWQATFSEEPQIDGLISGHENKQSALKELRTKTNTKNLDHVFGLKSQGRIFMTIIATFSKTTIKEWSAHVDSLPDHLFRFVRKACQQQLPTASNLQLWKKVPSDKCILCGSRQTNKHVLNNCSAPGVLERYKRRHDHVLSILAQWIKDRVGIESVLFADLSNPNFNSPADIFNSRRPDIVVQQNNRLVTLELTICHETNAATSRDYKISKYMDLQNKLLPGFANFKLTNHTIEITSLGFISDSTAFTKQINIDPMPGSIKQSLFKSTVSDSYSIYCSRNSLDS